MDSYIYVTDAESAERGLSSLQGESRRALDTESYPLREKYGERANALHHAFSRVRLLSLCGNSRGQIPILFDLDRVPEKVLERLREELLSPHITYTGHAITHDLRALRETLGIWVEEPRCTLTALKTLDLAIGWKQGGNRGRSLAAMVRDLLGQKLSKEEQVSNWGDKDLREKQLEYAALDVGAPGGMEYSSSVLRSYDLLQAECKRLGMEAAFDLEQSILRIFAEVEYEGVHPNVEFLRHMETPVRELVEERMAELCRELSLPMESKIERSPSGARIRRWYPSIRAREMVNHSPTMLGILVKKTGLPLGSLKEEEVDQYDHPILDLLRDYKRHSKLLSEVVKFLRLPHPETGAINAAFPSIATGTGRAGSRSLSEYATDKVGEGEEKAGLNITQTSGVQLTLMVKGDPWGYSHVEDALYKYRVKLRNAIIAQPGWVCADLDYQQQEPFIVAALSGDLSYLSIFYKTAYEPYLYDEQGKYSNPDADSHLQVTIAIFPELAEYSGRELVRVAKEECPAGKALPFRLFGKVTHLSVLYAKGPPALAVSLKVTPREAEGYINGMAARFPIQHAYMEKSATDAFTQRWIGDLPLGRTLWVAEENAKGLLDDSSVGRKGANARIQGTGALMTKMALRSIQEVVKEGLAKPVAFIHDGLLFLVRGKWKFSGIKVDGRGFAEPAFEYEDDSHLEVGKILADRMRAAEIEILRPYVARLGDAELTRTLPGLVEESYSPYWKH